MKRDESPEETLARLGVRVLPLAERLTPRSGSMCRLTRQRYREGC
jgi:hypothetical protein